MKVEIQTDGNITVQYYPAHYGHSSLSMSDEHPYSESTSRTPATTTAVTATSNGANLYHSQDHGQTYHQQSNDRLSSSSSSPGSSSTSPSAGSNSNSNHLSSSASMSISSSLPGSIVVPASTIPPASASYSSQHPSSSATSASTMRNNLNATFANAMSHCIIITPSLMLEEQSSMHTNDHSTPVFVVQQQLPSTTSATHLPHPTSRGVTTKE